MRDRILKVLIENNDKFLSGQAISSSLGITRSAVWKHIKSLQQDGFGSLDNDSNELYGLLTPQVRAFDALKMRDKAFEDAIRGGVTTVMVSPADPPQCFV